MNAFIMAPRELKVDGVQVNVDRFHQIQFQIKGAQKDIHEGEDGYIQVLDSTAARNCFYAHSVIFPDDIMPLIQE